METRLSSQSRTIAAAPTVQPGAAALRRPPPVRYRHRSSSKHLACLEARGGPGEGRAEGGVHRSQLSREDAAGRRQLLLTGSGWLATLAASLTGQAAAHAAPANSVASISSSNRSLADLVLAAKPAWPVAGSVEFPNYARPGPYMPAKLPTLEHTCAWLGLHGLAANGSFNYIDLPIEVVPALTYACGSLRRPRHECHRLAVATMRALLQTSGCAVAAETRLIAR